MTYVEFPRFNQIYWILNLLVWISFYAAHWIQPGFLRKNTDDYNKAIRMVIFRN